MTLVVDASVALRWFVEAPGSAEAAAVLDSGEALIAPSLVVSEVANAAWKLARSGEITEQHGLSVAAGVASSFDHLEPDRDLTVAAYRLASILDHPVYDCLYVALSERRDCPLLTADARLQGKLSGTEWGARLTPLTL